MTKQELYQQGHQLAERFIALNRLRSTPIRRVGPDDWRVGSCAYYRNNSGINICVEKCALPGYGGRAWSWPGYVVDRTPYGVVSHELGHHVDFLRGRQRGAYWSEFSTDLREQTGEEPITTYAPNDAEWFAEIFRLYVTNPDLLRLIRPRTHRELRRLFEPVFADGWRERLNGAPERTIRAAENKIERARG